MAIKVYYKASVQKDLSRLGHTASRQVLRKFERALAANLKRGEALKGEFQGLYKFRVGDYRVIYTPLHDGLLVLRIAHRKESYR